MKKAFTVAGIGELLWDVFPTHRRLGGAPANFACHCSRLGAEAYPVSCVGADALGGEIRRRLEAMGVDDRYVFESPDLPTGTVDVVLDGGRPTYEIHEDVAWDDIPCADELEALAGRLDAVCFGSLSQRSERSRRAVRAFVGGTPETALRIFDVNLRQAFHSKEVVAESLELATILKLSDEELPAMAAYFGLGGDVMDQLARLRDRFDLRLIAYTRGPDGGVLLGRDEMDDCSGRGGPAVDSVGAGDAFAAALCVGLLKGWTLGDVNAFANRVAAYVCSQKGATPALPRRLVDCDAKTGGEGRS